MYKEQTNKNADTATSLFWVIMFLGRARLAAHALMKQKLETALRGARERNQSSVLTMRGNAERYPSEKNKKLHRRR